MTLKIPLQSERAEAHSVGGIGGLEDEKGGNGVQGVLKASAEEAGEMRPGKDPSIAQPGVAQANVVCAASYGVTPGDPQLDLVAALLGTGLCDARGCSKQ